MNTPRAVELREVGEKIAAMDRAAFAAREKGDGASLRWLELEACKAEAAEAAIAYVRAELARREEPVADAYSAAYSAYVAKAEELDVPYPNRECLRAAVATTAPKAPEGWVNRWTAGAGTMTHSREAWGVIIDALMEHQESSNRRKGANPHSTCDDRARMCSHLVGVIGTAAAAPPSAEGKTK